VEYAVTIEGARGAGQDRAVVVKVAGGLVVALADGAGGTGNGARAAEAVIEAVQQGDVSGPLALLDDLDARIVGGETTAVVLRIEGELVEGASVGDSGAWVVDAEGIVELTDAQQRKPLVGAGGRPVGFVGELGAASTLVVASDGLLRYANAADIARVAQDASLERAAAALIELVRLPSGGLQDDVAIVLCRVAGSRGG
jgi:serine/threonine protein phosphatase PrpC